MGLTKTYLAVYNLACAGGWATVLALVAKSQYEGASWGQTWDAIATVLMVVQTAALAEVVHSATGIVKSPWVTTLLQVSSRLVVAWGFLYKCRDCQNHVAMALTVVSWALVEVPRYLFYVFNLGGGDKVPYPLFWLRYSLFAILYPSGITGEIWTMLNGVDCLKTAVPPLEFGSKSISMHYMIYLILATYIPGAPFMYGHMVTTRKKQFSRKTVKAE